MSLSEIRDSVSLKVRTSYPKLAFGGMGMFITLMMIVFERLALAKMFPENGQRVAEAVGLIGYMWT